MKTLLAVLLALVALPALAAIRTVTLSVPDMNCAACPITVRKALSNVEGVSSAKVDFERRLAIVTYDDSKTTVAALTAATGNAGYPSTPVVAK